MSNSNFDHELVIVPAAAGTVAVIIGGDYAKHDRPTMDDVTVWQRHVVAWEVTRCQFTGDYDSRPILSGRDFSNPDCDAPMLVLVVEPGGGFSCHHACLDLENLGEAKEIVLQRAQQYWDTRHARADAS
jgi:hypothetical protein